MKTDGRGLLPTVGVVGRSGVGRVVGRPSSDRRSGTVFVDELEDSFGDVHLIFDQSNPRLEVL